VVEAAVGAACTIANGPTAIYLVGHEGEITRTATAGTSATIAGLLPRTVRPGRLKLLRRALELGCRQSLPYAPGVPADERTLLGEAAARWLVATPIRGRHGVLGALLTLWRHRRRARLLSADQLQRGAVVPQRGGAAARSGGSHRRHGRRPDRHHGSQEGPGAAAAPRRRQRRPRVVARLHRRPRGGRPAGRPLLRRLVRDRPGRRRAAAAPPRRARRPPEGTPR